MILQRRVGKNYELSRGMRALAHCVIGFFILGQQTVAVAQTNIVVTDDGFWKTQAVTADKVTEITSGNSIGGNAYNSFEHFGVKNENTVNFRLNGVNNLVNLVRLSRSDINGVLNSYMDNGTTIGGNVFFVNPHGITVGATGTVNVGSLSMVVPTQAAIDDYISALEDTRSTADDRLLFVGDLKLAEDGDIDVQGTINAESGVLLLANTVNIGGNIISNGQARYDTGAELFSALVKVSEDFQDDLGIFEVDGEIVIGAVGSSGGIINDLNPVKNTSANITISDDANIQAGGTIQISATAKQDPASIDNGLIEWNTTSATVAIDGADITSNSGAVIIDSKANVELEIGGFDGLPISAAIARSNARSDVSISGDAKISAATDVTVSSSSKTKISATANAESEIATLTIAVANIDSTSSAVVKGTSTINAGAAVNIDSVSEADVKVMADGLLSDGSGGGLAIAVTDVDSKSTAGISDGAQVLNSGSVSVTSSVVNSIDTAARSVAKGNPQSISEAVNGEDNLNDNPAGDEGALKANIDTALNDSAELEDDGQATSPQLAAAFAYTGVDSSSVATINAGNDSTVDSTGNIDVVAKSMTDASNLAQGTTAVGADASITAGVSILISKEVISATVEPEVGNLSITANALNVAALNEDYSSVDNTVGEMVSLAYAGSGGGADMGLAGALAINIQDRDSIAGIYGDGKLTIDVDGNLYVTASSSVSDAVVASATLSEAEAQDAEDKFAANSAAQQDAGTPIENSNEGGSLGVGAAIAINVVDNNTQANIGSGVTMAAGANDVTVAASSDSKVITKAEAGSPGGISIVPVLALSTTKDTTLASINAGGALIDVDDSVVVSASHTGAVATYAKGAADGLSGGGTASVGASVGLGIASETTTATIARDVAAGTDSDDMVTITSSSTSSFATGAIASAGGSSDEGDGTTVDDQLAGVMDYRNSQSSDTATTESAETSDGKVGVAAAIAYQGTTSISESSVADGVSITSGGKLIVTSQKQTSSGSKANGAAAGTTAGVGAAVAVSTTTTSNIARVGDDAGTGSAMMETGGIEVIAYSDDAYVDDAVDESELALTQFGAAAVAGASSDGVGVAGALALNIVSETTTASIEGSTTINIDSAAVSIGAESQSSTKVSAAGTVGSGTLEIEEPETPSVTEGEAPDGEPADGSTSVGVGAGVAINAVSTTTSASIGSGVGFTDVSALVVDASSKADATIKATAGVAETEDGSPVSVGVGGAIAVSVIIDNTIAEIKNGIGTLDSDSAVSISASHKGTINVTSDASAAGDKVAIGASIAISVSDVDTQALISRDVIADNIVIAASSNTSNTTVAKASTAGAAPKEEDAGDPAPEGEKSSVNKDVDAWQTFASDKDDSGSTSGTETEDPDASSSEGQVSVAAAVAVTVTDVDTIAKINNDVTITTLNDVAITVSANTDAQATADGSAANGDIGVGVGVAINVANNYNAAFISQGADVQGGNISVSAIMTEDDVEGETDPDTVNTFGADATSGAGAATVGVAGSLGLNIVSNESHAYIAGNENSGTAAKVYTEGELTLTATNNAKHVTSAQASVGGDDSDGDTGDDTGKSVGIGASVAINTIINKTIAEIRDGVVIAGDRDVAATEAGSLTMASSSEYHSETKAEAGAEGEEGADPSNDIAVDAAVALVVANNETKTSIGDADTSIGFSGDIDLDATSNQSNTTEADGDSAGSSVAIGAVAAVNIGSSNTAITVNTDLKTSAGLITMDASSTSADKALAKASARGASKKKVQDKYDVSEDEVDSGDFGDGADDNKATSSSVLSNNSSTMQQPDTGDGEVDDKSGDKGDWSVSVAAAVGANIVDNDTSVIVTSSKKLAADGSININASSDSNYMTLGSGEAVAVTDNTSDQGGGGIGIGVGVAVTVAQNDTVVDVSSIENAGDVSITASSTQNMNEDFIKELTSEAIAGASADKVAVAGAVAVVVTDNDTRAEITDGAIIGDVGALSVTSEDQSKISSRAIAWVDPEKGTTAGVGASAAILVSKNTNTARIDDGVTINSADSINVSATNKRVTPETVGLDFSEIINFDDIMGSALLAGRTKASEDDEDNTGTEPEVDPETGGPAIIFDKLESTATDAKHALEDYIRSHNYYTEAAAGSASTSGSAKYGVAGSFAVTVLMNETEASIGNVTINNVAGNVDVTADTDTDIAGFTGSVVKAGSVGVGISATTLVNVDTTRALVGNDSAGAVGSVILGAVGGLLNIGDLNVSASSDQDILGIGVAAAAASSDSDDGESSGVAVSGVLNTTVLVNKAEARIANDAAIYSTGSVAVDAEGITDIVSVVGGIALGGKVGVGASVGTAVISGQTHAAIGDRAIVTAADSVGVAALANESIVSIVVGAGASKKVGVAGSVATNIIAASTTATIGNDAVITQTDARDAEGELNAISVNASDNTKLFSLAGGGAIGGKAGVGAAADVAVFSKNTIAETKAGSALTAGGNVDVSAKSKGDIISLTGAGAASSSGAAVAGVASVKVIVDKTHALINSQSVVADGNVDLLAQSDTDLNIYDGSIAISGGSAGVGGAVAVNTIVKDTAARVGTGVAITARGDVEDSQVYNGDLDRSGYISVGSIVRPDSDDEPAIGVNAGELTDAEKLTSDHRGLSVTAFSTEDIETIGISASASKSVAVAGNLAIDVIANITDAAIGAGATVNARGVDATDSSASVLVQAYDYTDLNAMLGSGAVGVSSAGVGAAGDVSAIIKKTTAHIDVGADVGAEQDVVIRAGSEEDIDSIAAAVGVGSSAGVSGATSVLVINSETRAYTESNLDSDTTNIDAGRDFVIEALDRTDIFMFNTALAAGSTAGVGGSAGVVVITNTTEAKAGRGTVSNAERRTVVRADSDENLIGIAMGAAGGGSAGVSGQLGVHVLATTTNAIIEDGVIVNKESWNDAGDEDEQSVAVIASNDVELLSISGTISLGGSAGVGGALTADVVTNKVRASVGNSEVYAGSAGNGNVDLDDGLIVEDGVSIRASSDKDIVAVSVAGAGGGSAGVAGAASIVIVGSDYDENDETSDSFGADMDKFTGTGEGGEDSSQLAQADSGSDSRTADTLGAQGDVEVSEGVSVAQYLDDNTQSSGSGYFTLDSAGSTSGDTVAVVASGATIKTKGDLEISANDDTGIVVVGGSLAIGGSAGVAGAGALVLLNQGTRAIVQDDDIQAVELDAARNMNINAQANSNIVDVTATVAAGGAAGVSGSLLLNVVDSRAEARIGDGALINQDIAADTDQSVIVDANNSTNMVATTANGSGSGTAAVGGVALVNVVVSRTSSSIGEAAQVKAKRDIMVIADSSEQVIANGASAAISGVAGVGGVINVNTIVSKTEAVIEADAFVDSDGNVLVAAEDDTLLVSNAWGIAIGLGGAGVGGSFGVNTIVKDTDARITEGATVNARGNNATMDVYTGDLVNPSAGDSLIGGLIDLIQADEPEEPEESDSGSGPSEAQSEGQADKWQTVVDESGANKDEDNLQSDDSPSLDNSKKSRVTMRGLAVVASSTEDIVSSNASAAGGLYAGVSGSGQVLSIVTDTDATVEKGVTIKSEDLRLSAADHTRSLSLSGGLAISGIAGVGGVIVSGNIIKSTNATLGTNAAAGEGVDVTASGDVYVDADSSDDIDEILVNVAGAGIAGVGGGVASHVVVSETTAEVGDNSVIDADSDLRIRANSNTEIDTFSGNLSLAGIAAVGGVVSSNVVANTTTARIGDGAKTDADDVTEVFTDSVTNIDAITVAASGGAVGVAGDVAVNVITTTAQSSIGQDALINTDGTGNAGQDILVTASDSSTINSDTGTIALGAVAVGGALSVDILRNSASATIGSGAQINAKNRIDVTASTEKTVDAKAVSAAAGGVGMSGSIAVAAIGGDLNDDAYDQINGEDDNGDTNSESGSINKTGSSSSVNPLASDNEDTQLNDFNATSSLSDDVDQRNADREADYGVSDDVATSPDSRSGTLAVVGSGATLKAGGDLNVTAQDTTTSNLLAGAVSAGGVAGAGAATITVVANNTEAMVASNAVLDSGADLTVSANNDKTLNATAASGAVSFATSIAGSIGVTVDSSTARAHIDSGAKINQDSAIRALASQQNVVVQAVNDAVIDVITGAISASLGFGIGGTLNVVTTSQTTQAYIDVGSTGRVSAEGLINVDADSIATSNARSAVGAGGLQAGIAGGVVTLFDDSTTSASIGNASVIDDADEVKVDADSSRTATAYTAAAAVGAIGVGGSAATAEMKGNTTASIASNAKLGTNGSIGSLDVDATATETATATAVALSAGIISGSGSVATTSIESTVAASTGRDAQIVADGAVAVTAQATPKASSRATAGSFGGATVGASVAVVEVAPTVTATIDGSDIEADSLLVSAKVLTPGSGKTADAYAEAASGGLLLGANATVSGTSVTGSARTLLATGTELQVAGSTSVISIHTSNQYAETKSFAAGLAALGGAFSSGDANTVSTVTIADGNNINAGSLTLNASGNDRNQVKAKSGTGGAIAGAAAVAETENTSITSVSVGNGTITTANLDIDASHTASFDHSTDSTSGGLLGASGAVGDHRVDAQVAVTLAGSIEAGVLDARSRNNVYKNLVSGFNVNAGAGGLLGGAAADSKTVISRMTSTVTVAPDTVITSGEYDTEGVVLEAANQLIADDSAKLDSGGAIAIALAETSVIANNVAATVTVGDRASIETGGDLTAAAYSDLDVRVDAKASTYGLAGAAQGESTAVVNASNTVAVNADSSLLSSGQIRLMAGRTADNQTLTQTILAYTDLWNKTAFPVETKPEADAFLNNNNYVGVAAGSVVAAGGDIYLVADKGSAEVKGQGIGKDLYRQEAEDTVNFFGSLVGADEVSFDITGGSTTSLAMEVVTVDGVVNTGIDNKLKFRIVRNELNNDLEFYEGDYVEGMAPTLIIRDTPAGLVAIDSAGNEFAVAIDSDGNYVIAPSEDGLSTSVKLELDFNPLQVMVDRLNEVTGELDDIYEKSGGLTSAQVTERDALFITGQTDDAGSQQAAGLLDNTFTLDSNGNVLIFAGVLQIRGSVTDADTTVGNGELIGTPLTLWQNQKAAYDAERQKWIDGTNEAPGLTPAQETDIIASLEDKATEIQDNLVVNGEAINTNLNNIAGWEAEEAADSSVDNSGLIAAANSDITIKLGLINSYDSITLSALETDLITERDTKAASSEQAFDDRADILPNESNIDATLQPYVNRLNQEKDWIQARIDDYGGANNAGTPAISYELIDFTDKLFATSADIFVDASSLTGSGSLIANRDTEISILNKTPAYLRISGGAEIPFDVGGNVYVNDAPIRESSLGGLTIGDGSDSFHQIKFFNDYAPPGTGGTSLEPPQGPDLIISADLSNFNGLIHLESLFGGVTTDAGVRVDADTIVIRAGRDVVISYAGGIRHIAGDVKCEFSGDCTSTSDAVPGVIAGNNVYVAGEYINVNGLIQSGIPKRVITITGTGVGQWENGGLVEKKVDEFGVTYFEVKPLFIAGGYVDLYGHIISAPLDTDNVAAGEIQVMDGYGEIEVINNTELDVRVTGMSAGTGVQAKVRITDLDFDLNQLGNDRITEYTYYRDNAADQRVEVTTTYQNNTVSQWKTDAESDNLAYNPLTGQQYSWENIRKDGWNQERDVVRETYFVLFGGDDVEVDRTTKAQVFTIDQAPIKDDLVVKGRPAGVSTTGAYAIEENTTSTTSNGWSTVPGSYDKDEYLVYRHEEWTESRSGTDFVYVKNFVTADKPIGINFVGNGTGIITLTSPGSGNIEIAGSILNPTGLTSIDSGAGDILQTNETAQIWTKDLSLAGRSIGEVTQTTVTAANGVDIERTVYIPIEINLTDGGRLLGANVTSGNIIIEQLDGDVLLGEMAAANGEIWLKATDSILNDEAAFPGNDNELTAERITLIASGGSVGTSDNVIRVNSGVSADGGLSVRAATDIHISKTDGDLYLISATSSTGDVNIDVANGSLVDNNAVETRDSRTIEQLLGIWDSMEFITGTTGDNGVNSIGNVSTEYDVANRNVEAQEAIKTREYQTYWNYRNALVDPSAPVTNTTVILSETEVSFFDEPDAVAAERSAEFARLDELYGDLGNTFNENYSYEVVVGSDEYESLTKNAGWTELELLAAFGPGLLKEISDTEIRIEEANVTGNNVNITVQNGDIGIFTPDAILIDLDAVADYTELTDDQKLALLTAERRDVRLDGYDAATDSYRQMWISTYDDVDVEVAGTLTADALDSQRIYIGSEDDLDITRVAGAGDVRIRTAGVLSDSFGTASAAITGKDIILESGNQSIGSATQAFTIDQLVDGSLTARAGDSIWLESTQSNTLAIDTVFAVNLFSLNSAGDVVEYDPDTGVDVRADSVTLDITGSFGAAGDLVNSIDVALNPGGMITAKIEQAAWITSPDRDLRIGNFEVGATSRVVGNGDLILRSEEGGMVSTGGTLTLLAGGSIVDEMMVFNYQDEVIEDDDGARAIEALELDLIASNGDIGSADNYLDIDVSGSQGVWAQAENGGIFIESPDSDLRLRNVTAGDNSAFTSGGDILLIQSGELRSTGGTLAFEADGSILDESGDSQIEAVDLSLQANNGTVGTMQRSLHVDTETISMLSASTGIYLTEVNGDMNIGNLYNGSGEVVLHVAEPDAGLNISGGIIDGRMIWTADNIFVENLVHGGNQEELYFEVTSSTGGMADEVNIQYQSDRKVRFGNLEANHARIIGDVNDLRFDRVLLGEWGVLSNDTTSVFIDNTNSGLRKEHTIQLTSKDAPFFLTFIPDSNRIETDAYVLYYDEDWIVNFFSNQNSLSRLVDKDLAYLSGAVPDINALAEHPVESAPVEVVDDALNMRLDNDSQLFLPLYWSDI
jgi:filamentous hemagglutinin family protein